MAPATQPIDLEREELEDAADAARIALQEAEAADAARHADFRAALENDAADPDAFFRENQARPVVVARLRLGAKQAEAALVEYDLAGATDARTEARTTLAAAEAANRETEKALQAARTVNSRAHGHWQNLIEQKRRLADEIERGRAQVYAAATGQRAGSLRPRP